MDKWEDKKVEKSQGFTAKWNPDYHEQKVYFLEFTKFKNKTNIRSF